MERRKLLALREYNAEAPYRSAYFEDSAKSAWMSAPVMAVAAAALLIGGHFLRKRGGRRTGGDGGNQGGTTSNRDSANRDSPESRGIEPQGNMALNLAQLRAFRAEAAEARLPKEGTSKATSTAAITPLGSILMLARKVDQLEEQCSAFFNNVSTSTTLIPTQQKELAQLLELLTQLQLKIDGVKGDENVRPHRKIQTTRVQSLLSALEKLSSESGKRDDN